MPSFWSLAVEAQLYLLYPIAIWLRQRWEMSTTLAIAIAVQLRMANVPLPFPRIVCIASVACMAQSYRIMARLALGAYTR